MFHQALKYLNDGYPVCFPTETVYGIGVDYLNSESVSQLYKLKRRPISKPFALLVSSLDFMIDYCDIPEEHLEFVTNNSNSTFVATLRRKEKFHSCATYCIRDNKIAFRVPSHSIPRKIIKDLSRPIVATSANFSEESSEIARYQDINTHLSQSIKFSIVKDENVSGKPSNVFDISGSSIICVR